MNMVVLAPELERIQRRAWSLELRELARIDAWEERERQGERLPTPHNARNGQGGPLLPVAPYRSWVRELLVKEGGDHKRVGARLGVSDRRVWAYLHEMDRGVFEAVVDAAITHDGTITLAELYPDGPATIVAESAPNPVSASSQRCRTPGCHEQADGRRFCEACSERLERVRAELEQSDSRFHGTVNGKPRCCFPGCQNARQRSERLCPSCLAEVDEADE